MLSFSFQLLSGAEIRIFGFLKNMGMSSSTHLQVHNCLEASGLQSIENLSKFCGISRILLILQFNWWTKKGASKYMNSWIWLDKIDHGDILSWSEKKSCLRTRQSGRNGLFVRSVFSFSILLLQKTGVFLTWSVFFSSMVTLMALKHWFSESTINLPSNGI